METKKKINRRKFLSGGFVAGTAIRSTDAEPTLTKLNTQDTRIMLTPDGKLVEVNTDVVDKAKQGKASNQEILKWSHSIPLKF
ncbi:MAG: hypothetical protein SH818_16920 [Saprospiraceae bacterium]|nr:hypothetical protein [Saprospiraceae bacterium]